MLCMLHDLSNTQSIELKKPLAEFLKIGQKAFLKNIAECVSPT